MNTTNASLTSSDGDKVPAPAHSSAGTPIDRDNVALAVTFEMQPFNDAITSLCVAVAGAESAARAVWPGDPASDVAAAWASHTTLIRECARLVETRAQVLVDAVQRLMQAR